MLPIKQIRIVAWLLAVALPSVTWADEETTGETTETRPVATGQLIEGIVLNHYGGGIVDALVRVEAIDAGVDDPPLVTCKTSEYGDVSVRLPEPVEGPVRIRISKEGYADWILEECDPTNEQNPPFIDATLEGAGAITGTILAAATDEPVAAALIRCSNGGRDLTATSDEQGQYTIPHIFPGPTRIEFAAEGYASHRAMLMIDDLTQEYDVRFDPELPIEITVLTDEGDPAAAVTVEAIALPMREYFFAAGDERGIARLRGVPTGAESLQLRLNGEGFVRTNQFEQTIELAAASRPAESRPADMDPVRRRVTIQRAASVKGVVRDAKSFEPVNGIRVVAGDTIRSDMPMTWTTFDGSYELGGLPPGVNILSFQSPEWATSVEEAHLNTGESKTVNVKLDAGLPIAGRVTDSDGNPVDQAWITAEDWKGYATLGLRTITSRDGSFSLAHAPRGDIEFSIVKPGLGPPVRQIMTAGKADYVIKIESTSAPGIPDVTMDAKIAAGKTVPDFTLTATDGTVYQLSKLRGKFVFLDFWATWCGPCRREMPNIKSLHERYKDRADFLLIGCNLDEERKAFKDYVEKNGLAWPQIHGPKSGAGETFQMLDGFGIPYTCLIGPDGTMLAQHMFGQDISGTVRKHLEEEKPE